MLCNIHSSALQAGRYTGLEGRLMLGSLRSNLSVVGGTHLTGHAFLPTAILKELSASESNFFPGYINLAWLLSLDLSGVDREQVG